MIEVSVPDFEEMFGLSSKIKDLLIAKSALTLQIEEAEKNVVITATTNEQYFKGGKPPSMEFIKTTYMVTGFNDELLPLRRELGKVLAELEKVRTDFQIYMAQIDVYRTESANTRKISAL